MQARRPLEDGRARQRRGHTRQRRGDGERGRLGAGFTIAAMAIGGIATLVLSGGDGAVEPAPPPAPSPRR